LSSAPASNWLHVSAASVRSTARARQINRPDARIALIASGCFSSARKFPPRLCRYDPRALGGDGRKGGRPNDPREVRRGPPHLEPASVLTHRNSQTAPLFRNSANGRFREREVSNASIWTVSKIWWQRWQMRQASSAQLLDFFQRVFHHGAQRPLARVFAALSLERPGPKRSTLSTGDQRQSLFSHSGARAFGEFIVRSSARGARERRNK